MFCPNCGSQVPDGANNCPNCGASMNPGAGTQNFGASSGNVQGQVNNTSATSKSKLAAGLLGIFLGWLGIHNFYLGKIARGVAQIVVTFVGWGLGASGLALATILVFSGKVGIIAFAYIISLIILFAGPLWGLIEGIMILCGKINKDANGNPLVD